MQARTLERAPPAARRGQYRTVWISDVHLGYRGCRADALLTFLRESDCERLYLVGDIVDLWQLGRRPFWPQQHNDVVRTILGKARYGCEVIYVIGNHDGALAPYLWQSFGQITLVERIVHERADGSRLLVLHGDQFDTLVATSRWLNSLGSHAYGALLLANTALNALRRRWGAPYWSLAGFIKHKVGNAVRYIDRYEAAVIAEAARAGLDGVVCGHIHRPGIVRAGEVVYYNCGDWVENCTALVEHGDGRMELLHSAAPAAADDALAVAA